MKVVWAGIALLLANAASGVQSASDDSAAAQGRSAIREVRDAARAIHLPPRTQAC